MIDCKEGFWKAEGRRKISDIFPIQFATKKEEKKFWREMSENAACEECDKTPGGDLTGWAIWFTPDGDNKTWVHVLCPHHAQIITRSLEGGTA